MIISTHGETHIEGNRLEIIFEFDEIFRIILEDNPEIVQASILAHEHELQNAKIDETVFILVEKVIKGKLDIQKKGGGYDDSRI